MSSWTPHVRGRGKKITSMPRKTRCAGFLQVQRRFAGGGHGGGKSKTALGRIIQEHPLLFTGISAGLLWGTGDAVAQGLQSQMSDKKSPEQGLSMNRLGGAVVHGVFVGGVFSYLWYDFMDKFVSRRFIQGTYRFVGAKLGMEVVIWHPICLFFYCTIAGIAEGHSWKQIKLELQETFLVTWAVDAAVWSPIDILNFRYVPPHLQALLINSISLLEAVALSAVHGQGAHGKDGPTKSSVLERKSRAFFEALLIHSAENFEDVEAALAKAKDEFERLDVGGKGYLTISELEAAARSRGLLPAEIDDSIRGEVMQCVFRKLDVDGSGNISLNEYLSFLRSFHEAGFRRSFMVHVVFQAFDKDKDERLNLSELTALVAGLDIVNGDAKHAQDVAAEFMRRMDENKDGSLSPEEIRSILDTA